MMNLSKLLSAYKSFSPNPSVPAERVTFGTSGHRGSSLTRSFNRDHILAITQAVVEWRAGQGICGPLYVGKDTHGLSDVAMDTVLEVLAGNGVVTRVVTRQRRWCLMPFWFITAPVPTSWRMA